MNGVGLLGSIFLSIGIPLTGLGIKFNVIVLCVFSVPLLIFGAILIYDDIIGHERIIKLILGIED